MAEPKRYHRSKVDIQQQLATERMNAETARMRAMQNEQAAGLAAQEAGFVQPGQNVQLASITPGFDVNQGTAAGGMAYQQGVDFGTHIPVQQQMAMGGPQAPAQVGYGQVAPPEELEQVNLEEFYSGYSQLNEIGQYAARVGVDVNNPDPLDPDAMEISRQYHQLYNGLLQQGEALQQGYSATEEAQKRNQLIEAHQGPTQFTDAIDAKKYDADVNALSLDAQEFYTRGAAGEANTMLFGDPNASIYDAAKSYKGRVGAYFYMADQLEAEGRPVEANLIRRKMFDVLGGVYDSTKQQALAIKQEDLARKKKKDDLAARKDYRKGRKTYDSIANLQKKIYELQNHGDIGFIKQHHPDAHYERDAGGSYVVWKDPKSFQEVRINVNDDEALAAQFMADNPKFIDVSLADYQEVKAEYGGYQPKPEENWQVKLNTQGFWDVTRHAQANATADNVRAVKDWLKPWAKFLNVDGKQVTGVAAEADYDSIGTDDIRLTLEDGSYVYYDMNDNENVHALNQVLESVDMNNAASYIKSHPKEFNTENPERFSSDEFDWKKKGLIMKIQRQDAAATIDNEERALNKLKSEYGVESSYTSNPVNTGNASTNNGSSGIDITKIGY